MYVKLRLLFTFCCCRNGLDNDRMNKDNCCGYIFDLLLSCIQTGPMSGLCDIIERIIGIRCLDYEEWLQVSSTFRWIPIKLGKFEKNVFIIMRPRETILTMQNFKFQFVNKSCRQTCSIGFFSRLLKGRALSLNP